MRQGEGCFLLEKYPTGGDGVGDNAEQQTSASATAERGAREGEAEPEGAGGRGQAEGLRIRDVCGVSQGWY